MPVLLFEGQVRYGGYPPDVAGRGFHQELLQLDAFRARAGQVNGLRARQHVEMVDVPGNGGGMDPQAPVQEVRVQAGIQETSFPLGGGPATRYQRQVELQAAAGHPGHVRLHVFQRSGPCRPERACLPECPHGFGRQHLAGWKPCEDQGSLCCQAAPDSRRTDREIQGGERIQGFPGQGIPRRGCGKHGEQPETHRRESRLQCPCQPACRTSYLCDPSPEQGHAA